MYLESSALFTLNTFNAWLCQATSSRHLSVVYELYVAMEMYKGEHFAFKEN